MNPIAEQSLVLRIAEELKEATAAAKCHKCGCFHSALAQLAAALHDTPAPVQAALAPVLAEGNATRIPEEYECLGCAVCWPANALNLAAQAFPEQMASAAPACPIDTPTLERAWPPLPGNYRVLDQAGHIAVCVLTSEPLLESFEAARPTGVAIVGTLYTENLGIERLARNILANPNLSTLLVCGADSKQRIGHLPGQSLLSLMAHGIDTRHRIVDAAGRRPVLRNLPIETIEAFRQTIHVVDRVGEEDPGRLLDIIRDLPLLPRSVQQIGVEVSRPAVIRAQPPARLVLDPRGYFILFPDRSRSCVLVEHYDNDGTLAQAFEGERAEDLCATILEYGLVSRLDHAAYLGKELARAIHALRTGEPYIQDAAPEPSCTAACGCQ